MFKEKITIFIMMLIAVPLAGELSFYPFEGDFRVSFGTPIFFFFLLWLRKMNRVLAGLLVGVFVVLFRILLEGVTGDKVIWDEALAMHFPVFFYYFTYGVMFGVMKIHHFYNRPIWVGILGILLEILASMVEISLRYSVSGELINFSTIILIIEIAFIRSFFVLGFFNILIFRKAKLAEEQQRQKNEHMLMLISNLYAETIQLKKSMQHAEDITRDCYQLYRKLKSRSEQKFAKDTLNITGQVHEIKKGNQRIYAGLSNLISNENFNDYWSMKEVGDIIVKSNEKYSDLLGKNIQFRLDLKGDHSSYHIYTVLSLLNNLVSNAVEAIKDSGIITISSYRHDQYVEFQVMDNGPGIPEKKKESIFRHGYTTKYDLSGRPSTGIGLSYVKELVESMGGTIKLNNGTGSKRTTFIIKLPVESLVQKG
ncbi:ATP-binding protein [Bacillus taeanensis]|uniref:ATP-binding protein n=1 Tax=Bacillus taeanensis TaxID=273032 RepID=UPI001FE55ABD|nr:ATP-binding protein [Bacillus taeanensis]